MSKKRIFFETEETVKRTKKGYIDLELDYFQFYNTAFNYLASLSSNCGKDFVLWVMSRVDDNNEFAYNREMYEDFSAALTKIQRPKTYTENTLHISLRELVDNEVLFRQGRGRYRVNPKLFWTDDTSKRISAVRIIKSNEVSEAKQIGHVEIPEATQEAEVVEENKLNGTAEQHS